MKPKKTRSTVNHSGSTFDSFLEEEGIREEVQAVAIKRVRAWQKRVELRSGQAHEGGCPHKRK